MTSNAALAALLRKEQNDKFDFFKQLWKQKKVEERKPAKDEDTGQLKDLDLSLQRVAIDFREMKCFREFL